MMDDWNGCYLSWFSKCRDTSHDFDDLLKSSDKKSMRLDFLLQRKEELKREYQHHAETLERMKKQTENNPMNLWLENMVKGDFALPMKKITSEFELIKKELSGEREEKDFDREKVEKAKRVDLRLLFPSVKRSGMGRYVTQCFMHEDKHPSMVLYPASGDHAPSYFCFVCNEGGDAISILMKRDGLSFHAAIDRLLTMV